MCLYVHGIKETQANLIRTERLEASTTVARKVVHEVNNPLGIIKNYLKILGLKLPEKHPAQTELAIISEEIDRVGQIVRGLKDYSVPEVSTLEPVNINTLLENILTIADSSILKPAMIQLHFTPDSTIPVIRTGKNGLKQVVINLIKNAAEAISEGGNIYVATMFHAASNAEPDSTVNQSSKIDIVIRDDGPGISEEIKRHLFEPFHSSKKEGHSGLGLSIVRNIIKKIGGDITCETSPETGTAFTVTLPTTTEKRTNNPGG
jgi:signal transduction histidine kinase